MNSSTPPAASIQPVRRNPFRKMRKTWVFHFMLLPAVIMAVLFHYLPMLGAVIAFQEYKPYLGFTGSEWVGLKHFKAMFERVDSIQVIWNTLLIASLKIGFMVAVPVAFALLLNEVRKMVFKRIVQTFVYLPHFLSWVILSAILVDLLSPEGGLVNRVLQNWFGLEPVFFLGNGDWFRFTLVTSEVWKEFGFSTIIYLASLASINPELYEAAEVDGASRWKQTMHITLPGLVPIMTVCATLSLSSILSAGFDQVYNLYNPLVYDKGDIIDTYVYRVGILSQKLSFATAIGLFKSVVSCILILAVYRVALKVANYRIF
ncbi:ABC transporter permease [Paenibacillus contaminans]|uniref:Sugar ABC transporter permease n=1 Tax=Paenibacillus contaminans TaxID=450362 RepID=A0A329MGW7_9BACL|nr:ABC transporter permease subunit [Paenibacillus contaminans]RAV19149.1 sugar ABC transporter permease [Paenibacillus contaminans]